MLNLTRQERSALIFLTATFLLGLVILFYKTKFDQPRIEIISKAEKNEAAPTLKIINVNTASKQELMRLKGIGPSLAETIIDFRDTNGRFLFKEDLMKVKGIGKAKFDSIEDYIKVHE